MSLAWGSMNKALKPFPKTPSRIVTITIDENGDQVFLASDSADIFLELGKTLKRRASHVLPVNFWKRQAFCILRAIASDTSRIAAWSRTWRGPWLVDTTPTAGIVLEGQWMDRQDAIRAEVAFLNEWFARR